MIDLQKFFHDFENLVNLFEKRNITRESLLIIKNKLSQKNKLIKETSQLRQKRNQLSQEKPKSTKEVWEIKEKISYQEEELNKLQKELEDLINQLPNLPASDTPNNQEGNRIVDITEYQHSIQHNLTYDKILRKLALIDEKKSLFLSGSKFAVYQNLGSQLLHALINFLRTENSKRGYSLFDVPYIVNDYNLFHTGQLPKFQDDLYKVQGSNFYLIPTAEVSLVNLYQRQILTEEVLPLKLCAYSPCFRAEAGATGQENKGLVRLHQFHKVELVKIVKPENSYLELEELVVDARNILQKLKISHRVIELCYEELGFSATKTYDLEVWLPVSKK